MLTARIRSTALGLAVGLAAAFAPPAPIALAADDEAGAQDPAEITVGAQLEALQDVAVGRAELSKGSKVNVVKLNHRKDRLASVDVELADGHVARVEATTIRTFFRVVTD